MSILIKGMEMPKDDEMLCINIYPDGRVCINMELQCKPVAQAVEIPPHGRLIDADKLRTDIKFSKNRFGSSTFLDYYDVSTIKNAPTIIEAEEGE